MNLSGNLNLEKIVQYKLPDVQFVKEEHDKKQIVLHHSAGWDNARGMFDGWAADKQRVATAMGIVDDGTIHQCFASKYWAWHINILSRGNSIRTDQRFKKYMTYAHAESLEKHSIGVEVCNWGPLLYDGDSSFATWAGTRITDEKRVIEYPGHGFRGHKYFERYTDAEIESLYKLIRYWAQRYNIQTTYTSDMWDVNVAAVSGHPGVWAHVSFRSDKSDMHPQPELLQMLKSL
jgi:N-acetyl-anhydromuramyl-L-alanine amidase AmpD